MCTPWTLVVFSFERLLFDKKKRLDLYIQLRQFISIARNPISENGPLFHKADNESPITEYM